MFLLCFLAHVGLNSFAQTTDNSIPYSAIFTNGTIASLSYNKNRMTLKVGVRQNEDEFEVLVVRNGMIVDSESTFFMDDEMDLDLSVNGVCDIYVKARNEIQYAGSVINTVKKEDEK